MNRLSHEFGYRVQLKRAVLGTLSIAAVTGISATHAVYAQSADGLEEIVVTAERRETDLQKTAISLTAIGGAELQESGKTTIEDALTTVPNVRLQTGLGPTSVFIRGVGPSLRTDAAVSTNFDGVYQTDGTTGEQFDIARIEVLRGPQGTFYGRNATAGSVNIVTNDPTNEYQTSASVQAGNYAAIRTEAMVNVPIADSLAIRTAISTDRHKGYYTNGTNDLDTTAARAKLLFKPADTLSMLLSGEYVHIGGHGNSTVPGNLAGPQITSSDPWFDPGPTGLQDYKKVSLYAKIDWDMGWGVLTYQPAYYLYKGNSDTDLLYTPAGLGAAVTDNDQHTEELRLRSSNDSKLVWVVGAYYLEHENQQPRSKDVPAPFMAAGGRGTPTSFPRIVQSSQDKATAVFGQATYPLTDALRLTTGLRYTKDEKIKTGVRYSAAYTIDPSIPAKSYSRTDNAVTGKIGIEYDLARASMLYAQVSKGYKSGGLNDISTVAVSGGAPVGAQQPSTYEPETIVAYEVGSKNRFFNDTLQLNAAAYYYDYKDQQIFAVYFDPGIPNPLVQVLNAAKARIYGVEFESQWLATPEDHIGASATYNSAKFVSYCNPPPIGLNLAGARTCTVSNSTAIGIDRSGDVEPNAPEWTGMLSYEHSFTFSGGTTLTPSATIRYTSSYEASAEPSLNVNSHQDAYHQTDARIVYGAEDKKWNVALFVNNIENKAVIIQGLRAPPLGPPPPYGTVRYQLAPPRTYGASFSARF